MMAVRTAIIGCVKFSEQMFKAALTIPELDIQAVITKESSTFNSDFASLAHTASDHSIPTYLANGPDADNIERFLQDHQIDFILCLGWSYLLPESLIHTAKYGCVGYHPAALPHNRGRHPLIWALVLGLKHTASTFFQLTATADTGAIVSQQAVEISPHDTADSLYKKITTIAEKQLLDFVPKLLNGDIQPISQKQEDGNHWRKRSPVDGKIDWRMTDDAIYNLVRALTKPYPGATMHYQQKDFCVWRVSKGPKTPDNLEPGKILACNGHLLLVKCCDGSIWIEEHELTHLPKEGEYLS